MKEICKHFPACGGCLHQGVPYETQLAGKEKRVRDLLAAAGLESVAVAPIKPAPSLYAYRNKMEYTFGNAAKGAPMTLGLHMKKSFMNVVDAEDCQLVPPEFNLLLAAVLAFCQEKGYPFYHKRIHQGLLRNLILRKGWKSGELLIKLVLTSQEAFDAGGFCDMLLSLPLAHQIAGILLTFKDSVSDGFYWDERKVLYGRPYYRERLLGLDFQVDAFSFFQTNVEAVEHLFSQAFSLIPDLAGKRVFDLYSGTGTLALAAAGRAREVVGVEISEESVAMARESARENGLAHCTFYQGDVLTVLDELESAPDAIIVDPPRAGIHPKAMRKIAAYGVPEILYISCNPATMVDNVKQAVEAGYRMEQLYPYDNFPFTRHIECVGVLKR